MPSLRLCGPHRSAFQRCQPRLEPDNLRERLCLAHVQPLALTRLMVSVGCTWSEAPGPTSFHKKNGSRHYGFEPQAAAPRPPAFVCEAGTAFVRLTYGRRANLLLRLSLKSWARNFTSRTEPLWVGFDPDCAPDALIWLTWSWTFTGEAKSSWQSAVSNPSAQDEHLRACLSRVSSANITFAASSSLASAPSGAFSWPKLRQPSRMTAITVLHLSAQVFF